MDDVSLLAARRDELARSAAFHGVVLVAAGQPIPIAGTDQSHEFHAHPDHRYLTGLEQPGRCSHSIRSKAGSCLRRCEGLRTACGRGTASRWRSWRRGPGSNTRDRLRSWRSGWERRRGEPIAIAGNDDILHRPERYGLSTWETLEPDIHFEASARLAERLAELRRTKDTGEIARMQGAADASLRGHVAAMRLARPGMTERQVEVEIKPKPGGRPAHGLRLNRGVGPERRDPHIAPTGRVLREGDIVMVDAGAEMDGYASDVSRTWPVSGRFEGLNGTSTSGC